MKHLKHMKYLGQIITSMAVLSLFIAGCGDDDCDTWYQDLNGDGLGNPAVSQISCTQPTGYVLDNSDTDDDCTLVTWYQDLDGDGLGNPAESQLSCTQPAGYVLDNTDTDDDCDTWYQDLDGDGLGNPALSQISCTQPAGYVLDNTDTDGVLNINFKMTYQGSPMVIGTRYEFDSREILFERVSFFISDLSLKTSSGADLIKDVDYVNLTESHTSLDGAMAGFDYTVDNVATGDFIGLSYNLGVDQELNATSPSDYDASSVLSNEAEFWSDWSSYIFMKIQGRIDTTGNGTLDQGVIMHLGSDAAFRTVDLMKDLTVDVDQITELPLVLDLYDVFDDGAVKYDFKAVPRTHSLDFIDQINFVATGVQRATVVN